MQEFEKDELLKKFMKEFFPYAQFKKARVFTKEMRNNYKAQAQHICSRLGLKSIYEYGSEEIRCHLSYEDGERPVSVNEDGKLQAEPFVTVVKSIYE